MNKKLLLLSAFLAGASWTVLAQDLVLSEGQYYTDETQTTPYTGRYTEFYEDGMLKMELYLKDGRPEGTYVIYYPDGKIAEVRSYYHGIFHGEWRTYSDNGPWRIWSDKGNLLYEMFYTAGKKSGVWRSWDEEGNLLSEENQ
jgi:antitoxin component YwqK of YwqJK toxin-antitoxin module